MDTNRYDRGLIEDDATLPDVDQRVGCAKINGQIGGKHPAEALEHYRSLIVKRSFGLLRTSSAYQPLCRITDLCDGLTNAPRSSVCNAKCQSNVATRGFLGKPQVC